ncbi:reticulophagy regulator 3 [Protopterus annectens]|uniref:reticulophagy regulator 3 n=1 Tax=Protopterus annectens TaxID=7888 RepID=UPI001CF9F8EE|nr:reticulophagy regulator 3 [Protopterus annectens]
MWSMKMALYCDDTAEMDPPVPAVVGSGLRSRPGSIERESRVQAVKVQMLELLGPYEPVMTYIQSVLVWEKPVHSVLIHLVVNVVFWFFALTSLRLLFVLAFGLIIVVCIDQWKNRIWPEIRVYRPLEYDSESWGFVHPKLLSLPELCHYIAEGWIYVADFLGNLLLFKKHNPGKFCLLVCGVLTFLAVLGRYIPGLLLSYLLLLLVLLLPLAVYHKLGQRLYSKLEPTLLRLDFSVKGYMMSKQKERQMGRGILHRGPIDNESDSEEELAAFCPKLDDSVVAKELTISDSEHSDAEVSYTDNGTFNLSRGQTPLTEGSEDFDRHSDPEESFARDLPDFPSINPDVAGIDDDDDTSIGIPTTSYRTLGHDETSLYDQEEIDEELSLSSMPGFHNFTNNPELDIAGMVTRGMIQLALSKSNQQAQTRTHGHQRGEQTYSRNSNSEMDTDAEGDDFEVLDQSELSQIDSAD